MPSACGLQRLLTSRASAGKMISVAATMWGCNVEQNTACLQEAHDVYVHAVLQHVTTLSRFTALRRLSLEGAYGLSPAQVCTVTLQLSRKVALPSDQLAVASMTPLRTEQPCMHSANLRQALSGPMHI